MIQYNIYINDVYLYTTLCNYGAEAEKLAKDELRLQFELTNPKFTYEDLKVFCNSLYTDLKSLLKKGVTPSDMAYRMYDGIRLDSGTCKAVPTIVDSIKEDDLILDYVIYDS